jgi:hypothetical protein
MPADYIGGSDARIFHDAADKIATLEAEAIPRARPGTQGGTMTKDETKERLQREGRKIEAGQHSNMAFYARRNMLDFSIKSYSFGQYSDAALPEWKDGEKEAEWFERLGYYNFALDEFGCDGGETGLQIYGKRSDVTNDLPEYLVIVSIGSTCTHIGVADHLNLVLLCRDFAPLAQMFLLQAVFDALFQDKNGWFDFQRLDALKDFIKQ